MSAYYLTHDPQQVQMFKDWIERRRAWGDRLHALADELGRVPVTANSFGREEFRGFSLLTDEKYGKGYYVGTPWIYESAGPGYLRPRPNTKDGKALLEQMRSIGHLDGPHEGLVGIPQRTGMFGLTAPGMRLNADEDALVLHYTDTVEHDDRWTELKASEWHAIAEECKAQEVKAA